MTEVLMPMPAILAYQFFSDAFFYYSAFVFPALSLLSFLLYGIDKWKAKRGTWRIPEATLLQCDMLGGWVGGLIAQRTFRHKTYKSTYRWRFWLFGVAGNVTLWCIIAYLSFA